MKFLGISHLSSSANGRYHFAYYVTQLDDKAILRNICFQNDKPFEYAFSV